MSQGAPYVNQFTVQASLETKYTVRRNSSFTALLSFKECVGYHIT